MMLSEFRLCPPELKSVGLSATLLQSLCNDLNNKCRNAEPSGKATEPDGELVRKCRDR